MVSLQMFAYVPFSNLVWFLKKSSGTLTPDSPSLFKGWRETWYDETERQRRVKIWELGLHLRPQDAHWDHEQPLELQEGLSLPHPSDGRVLGRQPVPSQAAQQQQQQAAQQQAVRLTPTTNHPPQHSFFLVC